MRHNVGSRCRPYEPWLLLLTLATLVGAVCPAAAQQAQSFREDFKTLDRWQALHFPKIPEHSTYTIVRENDQSFLRMRSDNSASGLVLKESLTIDAASRLRWRWKVENVYRTSDLSRKRGDDSPARIYVLFKCNLDEVGFFTRRRCEATAEMYGGFPVLNALTYIWASRRHDKRIIPNAYTGYAQMVLVEQGPAKTGRWVEEEVDLFADYRKAFGNAPPATIRLAIMNDSDNTGESATSYIDYIEVGK